MTRRARPLNGPARKGAAAVEFAVVMTFVVVPMLVGLWELGRAVQVQQIVANAARDGARLAAQGRTVNSTGTTTDILAQPAPLDATLPNVKAAVYQSLIGAGLTQLRLADVTVAFAFASPGGRVNPAEGLKSERFSVKVTINYDEKVRWVNFVIPPAYRPTTISYTADWRMMVDEPFAAPGPIPVW